MKNRKLILVIGFIIGSVLFGLLSQYIGDMIYRNSTKPDNFRYNYTSNWEDNRKIDGSKPWDSK